jgi:hypothetical protein
MPVGCMIGGVAGALAILALLGLGAWWLFSSRSATPTKAAPVAQNPPQNNPPQNPPPKINPPPQNPPPVNPPVNPPKVDLPPVWTVKPDPAAAPVKLTLAAKKEVTLTGLGRDVVFPTAPSLFVAVGSFNQGNEEVQVWNLQTMTMTGKVTRQTGSTNLLLSPDGAHLAAVSRSSTIEVWTVATGQSKVIGAGPGNIEVCDFAGPGKLVTARPADGKNVVQVWDVATGKAERQFDGPPRLLRDVIGVSPGYNYAALASPETLWVYDLRTGALAGQRAFPKPEGGRSSLIRGLVFSPDGAELAAYFRVATRSRIVCWDVTKGDVLADHNLPSDTRTSPSLGAAYRMHPIDWLPNRRGWLVLGLNAIDHNSGRPIGSLPVPDRLSLGVRRLIGPEHIAVLSGPRTASVLAVDRFNAEAIRIGP